MLEISNDAKCYPAPAKLNLDLRIIGRRDDGYHLLESIFCLIDLHDDIWIAPRQDGGILLHNPVESLEPEEDLTYRAAKLLQPYATYPNLAGVDIWQNKCIPSGGGLGGGSSDAATVLYVLNRLWQCNLSVEQLIDLGVQLGADVPFFLFGQNAFVEGIGEKLKPFEVPEQWFVIIKPHIHIPTPTIFSHKNLTRDSKPSIMPTFQSLKPFRNDMQSVVEEMFPEIKKILQKLKAIAGNSQMTGSGSCVFAVCDNELDANQICYKAKQLIDAKVFKVKSLAHHPLKQFSF